jgi:hypothetical protein
VRVVRVTSIIAPTLVSSGVPAPALLAGIDTGAAFAPGSSGAAAALAMPPRGGGSGGGGGGGGAAPPASPSAASAPAQLVNRTAWE